MRLLAGVRERLRAVLLRSREDADLGEELRDHLEREMAENQRRGMTPKEARRQALLAFGGVDRIREEVREARGLGVLDDLAGDVRYALRALRRNPAFTIVALLTLTLGIGANTAMFSLVNGILLRPLPYDGPDELVRVYQANPAAGELSGRISFQDLQDYQARAHFFREIAGFANMPTILTGQGDPVEVQLTYVTPEFFPLLGVTPLQGRLLVEEDHRAAMPSAVISESLWRTYLGADARVVGNRILLRGEPYTVVGVVPATMRHPTPGTAVWVPHSLVEPNVFANGFPQRDDRYLEAIGRLSPGATVEQAQQELTSLSGELAATYPESNEGWNAATVVPLQTSIVGDVDAALLMVLGVVGFILLIGCANLANLLLARGIARRREMAIRLALGAGRTRIVRQLLTENMLLSLMGGALGLLVSFWVVRIIVALSAGTLPRVEDVRIDANVITFTILLSTFTGTVFGLIPALRTAAIPPQADLREGRGAIGGDGRRARSALIVAEVALAVLLVVGAGLMVRSFFKLRNVDAGFDADRVLTVSMQLNLTGVPEAEVVKHLINRRQEYIDALRALPGVRFAGAINVFPLSDAADFTQEFTPARPDLQTRVNADTRYVDPGYFQAMGIALLRGDSLPRSWPADAPVPVLLSRETARRLFADEDPIGERIRAPWGEAIVTGVTADVRQTGMAQAPEPAVYFPHSIAPRLLVTIVLRTAGNPAGLAGPVRQAIKTIDPNQPIRAITPLRTIVSESIAEDRFFTVLFALFGTLALLLAVVGIYGVVSYNVRQRTQEIGVRIAMGAEPADVLKLVAGSGMKLVAAGMMIGTAAAVVMTRLLERQLYGITTTDPLSFAAALGFLALIAFVAICIPAYAATRVPPMIALRPE